MREVKVVIWREGGKEGTVLGLRTAVRMKRRLSRSVACSLGSSFGYVSVIIVLKYQQIRLAARRGLRFLVVCTSLYLLLVPFLGKVICFLFSDTVFCVSEKRFSHCKSLGELRYR